MKLNFCIVLLHLLFCTCLYGQVTMPYAPIETDSTIYEDGIDIDELEKILRTSDFEGEKSTQGGYQRYKPKGKRIACICMDGEKQEKIGRGACSGHGGVRFWVNKTNDGEELLYPTQRHADHPHALDEDELSQLSSRNEGNKKHTYYFHQPTNMIFLFLIVLVICITTMYAIKILFKDNKKS